MTGLSLLPIFLVGLFGGVHCIGMCGGIVSAFSAAAKPRAARSPGAPFPVPVMTIKADPGDAGSGAQLADGLLRVASYNAGRIGSYMVAGALAGSMLGGVQAMLDLASLRLAMYWLANGMLVALGLYLMDAWRGLSFLETLGQGLWRRIQPLMKPLLPIDRPAKALALGALWGWVPCGMVYSVLTTAMLTGTATGGAAVMLAFGLGTLPTLMAMGLAGERLRGLARQRRFRIMAGALVLAFGLIGMLRAANGFQAGWLDVFCIAPPAAGVHR
nr:sulfite exporter TauE/SafE family protein [Lacisediminimonas profundi]